MRIVSLSRICACGVLTLICAFAWASVAPDDKKPTTKPEPPKVALPKPTPHSPAPPKPTPPKPTPHSPTPLKPTPIHPTTPKPAPSPSTKRHHPQAFYCPTCRRQIGTCTAQPIGGICHYSGAPKCPSCEADVSQVTHVHTN